MHLVAIGSSDAGISAALRARELDPSAEVTVVVADAYPNFSICGIPMLISREVATWQNLAHRTCADLEATGMQLAVDTRATSIDVTAQRLHVTRPTEPRTPSATTNSSSGPASAPATSASRWPRAHPARGVSFHPCARLPARSRRSPRGSSAWLYCPPESSAIKRRSP